MIQHKKITIDSNHLYLLPMSLNAGGGYLLIDTGPNSKNAITLVEEHLNKINVKKEEIKKILITHAHADHAGLGAYWSQFNIDLFGGAPDMSAFTAGDQWKTINTKKIINQLTAIGLPKETVNEWIINNEGQFLNKWEPIPWNKIKPVVGGHIFPLINNRILEVIACPGHTPGSIAGYIKEDGYLYSGDTILKDTIPSTGMHFSSISSEKKWNGNLHFRNSIHQLMNKDIKHIFPGHGDTIKEPIATMNYYNNHYNRFENKLLSLLKDDQFDATQITNLLFKQLSNFTSTNVIQATIKVIGVIDKLIEEKRIRQIDNKYTIQKNA
jgi:glyoxylase-like metal-dependent hydrolase (beta-lactamase superfamily II)|tara:strand:+ start:278 stop:1252 length:975 start_codon:yes stop_codon:yes gene_type:complete